MAKLAGCTLAHAYIMMILNPLEYYFGTSEKDNYVLKVQAYFTYTCIHVTLSLEMP